jgi:hypothetical protein
MKELSVTTEHPAQAKLERGTLKTLGWASPLVDCFREFISANSRPLQNRPERGTDSFSQNLVKRAKRAKCF